MFFHSAARDFWLLAIAGGGAAARYVQLRARRRIRRHCGDETVPTFLLDEQQEHGYNAHSLVSIAPGAHFWYCPELDGAIVYNEIGKVWLVPGDPLVRSSDAAELTRRFIQAARKERRFVAFMPATERFAIAAASLGLCAAKIGAAPYFDLASWGPRGDRAKKARAGVNQARRAGVRVGHVSYVDHALKDETALLCESWVHARRCAIKLGWLFALDPFQHATRKKFFTARDSGGKLVGFLAASPMPARNGWYLEDVIRLPNAPVGTADLLVVEALNFFKLQGAKIATLGTSPLAADGSISPLVGNRKLVSKLIRLAAGCFAVFYNFEGLRRFKSKFAPSWWESEYILFPSDLAAPPYIISAFIHAIAPEGASHLVAQSVARLLGFERLKHKKLSETRKSAVGVAEEQRGPMIAIDSAMIDNKLRLEVEEQPTETELEKQVHGQYFGQFVSVGGLRLHYVSRGAGRPVVFIHGNPGSHQDYSMTVLGEVSRSYRAFAFDRPGHGYSERNNGRPVTVELQARLLMGALQELKIERPLIVGHSWGAAVALAMALEQEEELSGLVLLAPAAFPSGSSQWWAALPNLPMLGSLFLKALTPLIGSRLIKANLKEAYHPDAIQMEYLKAAQSLWTRPEQVKACAHDDRSLNESLSQLRNHYGEIQLPVVIVTGDSDLLVKPEEHAERLHGMIRGSKLMRLLRTGHQIPHTRPESVYEGIEMAWQLADRR